MLHAVAAGQSPLPSPRHRAQSVRLAVLYNDWDPKLDVKSVCLSLRSMLSSAKRKKRPPDNDSTVVMSQGQKTRNMRAWRPSRLPSRLPRPARSPRACRAARVLACHAHTCTRATSTRPRRLARAYAHC